MSKVWESTFSAIYDPLLWVAEGAGTAQRRAELVHPLAIGTAAA